MTWVFVILGAVALVVVGVFLVLIPRLSPRPSANREDVLERLRRLTVGSSTWRLDYVTNAHLPIRRCMSQSTHHPQEPVIQDLIGLYEVAVTTRNYHEADAIRAAIRRAFKLRPPVRTHRDDPPVTSAH